MCYEPLRAPQFSDTVTNLCFIICIVPILSHSQPRSHNRLLCCYDVQTIIIIIISKLFVLINMTRFDLSRVETGLVILLMHSFYFIYLVVTIL
jgi:hypothetical protein